jgi:glutamyl-tRNA synthetase/glutamyl-Q tRNA(Asp) synthetase
MRRLDLTGMAGTGAPLVTRFAPSPTGYLHLGHVVNAIYVWGIARVLGARVLLRIEDHDRIRCRPEYEDALLEDLDWLGFVADAGRQPLFRQRDRGASYEAALTHLASKGHVYRCRCSRRVIAGEHYPGTCRHLMLTTRDASALRLEVGPGSVTFEDLLLGRQRQEPATQCGDLLLRDRDGHWTYQFAVTVDDIEHGVNLVIRGTDLLESTGRQLHLARLMGREVPPIYVHHPLILTPSGRKLSKSDQATGIRELRVAGLTPARVIGRAAALAGLTDTETEVAAAAVGGFWDRI